MPMTIATITTLPTMRVAASVSVVIVNHDGGQQILACLAALEHSLGREAEIIVVDNASIDGSVDAIARRFPHCHLVRSPSNEGFGAGNNLGWLAAHGEYLVFLNPDTLPEAGWLEGLLKPLIADASLGATTARIVLADRPDLLNTGGTEVHVSGLSLCRGMGRAANEFDTATEVAAFSGAAFAMRREVYEMLGGFDEAFFLYMEDTDLSLRLRLAGLRITYIPESVVRHDYTLDFTARKTFYQERNRYLMLLKAFRWGTLLALLPALLLAEVVTWGFVLWGDRANWRNKLEACTWIVRHWRAVMAKRREAQRLRYVCDRELLRVMTHHLDFTQVGNGWVPRLARVVFDPLFFMLRGLVMAVVWW
jgi:hypothetical protein